MQVVHTAITGLQKVNIHRSLSILHTKACGEIPWASSIQLTSTQSNLTPAKIYFASLIPFSSKVLTSVKFSGVRCCVTQQNVTNVSEEPFRVISGRGQILTPSNWPSTVGSIILPDNGGRESFRNMRETAPMYMSQKFSLSCHERL
jgi:hypothetical protein